ncbi:MAG: hypothetical protein DRQ51_08660 [Gammaproteobacteria bacterium]|nr:MAG: hypothetical protein DRQ51_08660 [Gammaproteobacteria bacterium]
MGFYRLFLLELWKKSSQNYKIVGADLCVRPNYNKTYKKNKPLKKLRHCERPDHLLFKVVRECGSLLLLSVYFNKIATLAGSLAMTGFALFVMYGLFCCSHFSKVGIYTTQKLKILEL